MWYEGDGDDDLLLIANSCGREMDPEAELKRPQILDNAGFAVF